LFKTESERQLVFRNYPVKAWVPEKINRTLLRPIAFSRQEFGEFWSESADRFVVEILAGE